LHVFTVKNKSHTKNRGAPESAGPVAIATFATIVNPGPIVFAAIVNPALLPTSATVSQFRNEFFNNTTAV